jgi:hypothetical protein
MAHNPLQMLSIRSMVIFFIRDPNATLVSALSLNPISLEFHYNCCSKDDSLNY